MNINNSTNSSSIINNKNSNNKNKTTIFGSENTNNKKTINTL